MSYNYICFYFTTFSKHTVFLIAKQYIHVLLFKIIKFKYQCIILLYELKYDELKHKHVLDLCMVN